MLYNNCVCYIGLTKPPRNVEKPSTKKHDSLSSKKEHSTNGQSSHDNSHTKELSYQDDHVSTTSSPESIRKSPNVKLSPKKILKSPISKLKVKAMPKEEKETLLYMSLNVPPHEKADAIYKELKIPGLEPLQLVRVENEELFRQRGNLRPLRKSSQTSASEVVMDTESEETMDEDETEEDEEDEGEKEEIVHVKREKRISSKDDVVHCICGNNLDEGFMIQVRDLYIDHMIIM